MINCFLLFHKCGNNYVLNVHRIDTKTQFIRSIQPPEVANIVEYDKPGTIVNLRCRNFDDNTIENSGLLNVESARFLIFTRDPASFILSAVKYHLRGREEWAVKKTQKIHGDKTLTQALKEANSLDEQQIIVMKQFDSLYMKQVSLLKYLNDPRFLRIRCEDIFTTTEEAYFSNIARFLRFSDRSTFLRALKAASPAFKRIMLSRHSTGAYKVENPYLALSGTARDYYDAHWMEYAQALNYRVVPQK